MPKPYLYVITAIASVLAMALGVAYSWERSAHGSDRRALTYAEGAVELQCQFLQNEVAGSAKALVEGDDTRALTAMTIDGRVAEKMNVVWYRDYSACGFARQWLNLQDQNGDLLAFRRLADAAMEQRGPELITTLQAMTDRIAALRDRPTRR